MKAIKAAEAAEEFAKAMCKYSDMKASQWEKEDTEGQPCAEPCVDSFNVACMAINEELEAIRAAAKAAKVAAILAEKANIPYVNLYYNKYGDDDSDSDTECELKFRVRNMIR